MRTLIIGDIHGCYKELRDLLDKAGLNDDDQIIALGDLVNRGPQNHKTLNYFRENALQSIMGNHEQKHLLAHQGKLRPNTSTLHTRWQLGTDYTAALAYMDSLPTYIDLPDALLIHAYYEPYIPLKAQKAEMLVGGKGMGRYLNATYDRPWYEYYDGDKPLICGHRDWTGVMKVFNYKDKVFGLDTRCVYGGSLTGVLLPEWTFVSVPARRDHFTRFRKRYLIDGD